MVEDVDRLELNGLVGFWGDFVKNAVFGTGWEDGSAGFIHTPLSGFVLERKNVAALLRAFICCRGLGNRNIHCSRSTGAVPKPLMHNL